MTAATAIGAASMLALGGWAFLAPASSAAFISYTPTLVGVYALSVMITRRTS